MNSAAALTIDARCLSGGVGTYAANIVRGVRHANSDLKITVLTSPGSKETFAPFCDVVRVMDAPIFGVREQIELVRAASGELLHCTHYNAPLLRKGPMIVTIPDVTPLIGGAYHNSRKSSLFSGFALQAVARRADHILTVSDYSRARIIEMLRVPAHKISVAYNGVGEEFRPIEQRCARAVCGERLGLADRFLLYVGNLRPHKNVGALLRAYKICRQAYRIEQHLALIATGTVQATNSLRRLAVELGIDDFVHFVGSVDERTLIAAYNAADALVIPSLEEGFCLPVIEAMACGTPVACSDASALPEIAGEAAAYFAPHDPADIADIVQTVVEKSDLRQYMRTRGFAIAARYKWSESVRLHLDVYSRFLDSSPCFQPPSPSCHSVADGMPLAEAAPTNRI